MPEPFQLKKRFLHLLPAERELWSKWLSQYEKGWTNYQFDIHVGEGITFEEPREKWIQDLATLLTQKRIDVTAKRGKALWIFEVKPGAALSAYGQLLAYKELYRKTFKYEGAIELAVVTDRLGPDEKYLFRGAGIHIFLV